MKCLCCGKEIREGKGINGWHESCIKSFFGTKVLPEIDITKAKIERLASSNIKNGLTVTGVQKKLSIDLENTDYKPRCTIVDYPFGYILKPQENDYKCLPESEQLLMNMAEHIKIKTVPHALVKYKDGFAYITKRVDRIKNENKILKVPMEDFCQLAGRLTEDKYKSSYEICTKIIKKYSVLEQYDLSEFFIRIVYSFITGNSDMHLKNFSLIYSKKDNGYVLSPAYDLVPSAIMVNDQEEMALTVNGKKTKITKNDFHKLAEHCNLSKNSAIKIIKKIISYEDYFISMIEESLITDEQKLALINLLKERISRFRFN